MTNSLTKSHFFNSKEALMKWLQINHNQKEGIWVVYYKKSSKKAHIFYDDIVDACLCYGWIDSVPGKLDEEKTKLYISPRRPKSEWSKRNKLKIDTLIQLQLMQEPGFAKIRAAKEDGTWNKLNSSDDLIIPKDLRQKLNQLNGAYNYFIAFPNGVKKNILAWINSAKTQKTRIKRIDQTALLAQDNIRANQWKNSN